MDNHLNDRFNPSFSTMSSASGNTECPLTRNYKSFEEYIRLELIRLSEAYGFSTKRHYEPIGKYLTSCNELRDRAEHLGSVQLKRPIRDLEDVLKKLTCAIELRGKVSAKYGLESCPLHGERERILEEIRQHLMSPGESITKSSPARN